MDSIYLYDSNKVFVECIEWDVNDDTFFNEINKILECFEGNKENFLIDIKFIKRHWRNIIKEDCDFFEMLDKNEWIVKFFVKINKKLIDLFKKFNLKNQI